MLHPRGWPRICREGLSSLPCDSALLLSLPFPSLPVPSRPFPSDCTASHPPAMETEAKDKKQRQSQSCDACRVRKVKCEPMTEDTTAEGTPKIEQQEASAAAASSAAAADKARTRCKQCHQLGVECLYIYRPRKRGPPNLYLRKLEEAQRAGERFPAEADFEAAKASSRAVAERRKGGKGREGHVVGNGGGGKEGEGIRESAFGVQGSEMGTVRESTSSSSRHVLSRQQYDSRQPGTASTSTGTSHLMGESFIRTPILPDTMAHAEHQKYSLPNLENNSSSGTGRPEASEDAFTPSQFMNLDADLNFTTTPGTAGAGGKPSASPSHHVKYSPRHASRLDSYPNSEMGIDITTRHPVHPLTGRSHPSTTANAFPTHHRSSNAPMAQENTLNPMLSPAGANLEHAGAYFTSPSETGSVLAGIGAGGPSHYPAVGGGSSTSLLPDRLGSSPSRSISMDVSSLPNVERQFMMRPSVAHSTTAVHGDPSTGGTDAQADGLPMHTLTSKTLGEVGAPYLYSRAAKDGNTGRGHGESPTTSSVVRGDSKNAASYNEQRFGALHQPPFHGINANPLEAIIPRPLLHHIISLFFDYVYPLTPCLHKPTFIQDLARQREMEPNQGEWITLVLATVMSTLVQVPRAFVPLTRREVKDLAYRCHIAGRQWSLQGYKDFTVNAGMSRVRKGGRGC